MADVKRLARATPVQERKALLIELPAQVGKAFDEGQKPAAWTYHMQASQSPRKALSRSRRPYGFHTERGSTRDHDHGHQPARRARVILGIGIGLYLLSLGGLVGTVVERIRFDHRRARILAHYDALLRARQAALMTIEHEIAQGLPPKSVDPAPVPFGMRAEVAGN